MTAEVCRKERQTDESREVFVVISLMKDDYYYLVEESVTV